MHPFRRCPYLIESLRTPKWVSNQEIELQIEQKLNQIPKLKETVERIRTEIAILTPKMTKTESMEEQATATDSPISVFAVGGTSFKLENCWILDSGAGIHICNDPDRFKFDRPASEDSIIFSGRTTYPIKAYGSVMITVKAPSGPIPIRLVNVALVPGFFTSLVALRRLTEKGVHWDTKNERLHRAGKTFCLTQNVDDHWVLEYNKPT